MCDLEACQVTLFSDALMNGAIEKFEQGKILAVCSIRLLNDEWTIVLLTL